MNSTREEELKAIEAAIAEGKFKKLDPINGADAVLNREKVVKELVRDATKKKRSKAKAARGIVE